MRRPVAVLLLALLAATACAERADDADAIVDGDTASVDASTSETDAQSSDSDAPGDGAASAAEPGDGVVATIPARFHGEWNADRSACGTGSSETRLRISADRIRFYESVGVVREVDVESDRVIVVTAEYTGEGETWEDERRLTLSADGGSLTVSGGGDLVRQRCP